MHVVLFAFSTPDAWAVVKPLGRALRSLGHRVTIVDFSAENTPPALEGACDARVSLADGGLETLPRVTEEEFRDLQGPPIDFALCNLHQLLAERLPYTRSAMFLEAPRYQQMRGLALRAGQWLAALQPDIALIPQGVTAIPAVLAELCTLSRLPYLLYESAFFPGHLLLDAHGMHFFPRANRIDHDWPVFSQHALSPAKRERLRNFLSDWRTSGTSKYEQPESAEEMQRVQGHIRSNPDRVLFFADQIAGDANVLLGTGHFWSPDEMLGYLQSSLDESWRIIVKRHPRNPLPGASSADPQGRTLFVDKLSVHTLIQLSTVTAVFSSNVGFEALLYGKPVVTGGAPYYGRRGLTIDLRGRRLATPTTAWSRFQPDADLLERFANYVIFEYLIREEDSLALARRLEEAILLRKSEPTRLPALRAAYPRHAARYLDQIAQYHDLALKNFSHQEILRQLQVTLTTDTGELALNSGERQVAANYADIRRDHLARYTFAADLIRAYPTPTILDIACGVGYGAYLLADQCEAQVTAVDASEEAIRFAGKAWQHPRVKYLTASAGSFPWPAEPTYHAVTCFETLEHLADDKSFLRTLWSALLPGGMLVGSVPHRYNYPLQGHPFHVRHYDESSLLRTLSSLPAAVVTLLTAQEADGTIGGRWPRFLYFVVTKSKKKECGQHDFTYQLPYALQELPARRSAGLPTTRFFFPLGYRPEADTCVVSLDNGPGYVMHGPYISWPIGEYTVRTDVIIRYPKSLGSYGELTFDVVSVERDQIRVLASQKMTLQAVWSLGGPILAFSHDGRGQLEFRIFANTAVEGAEVVVGWTQVEPVIR